MTIKHKTTRLHKGAYDYRGWHIEAPRPGQPQWHAGKGRTGFSADTMRRCKEWIDEQHQ